MRLDGIRGRAGGAGSAGDPGSPINFEGRSGPARGAVAGIGGGAAKGQKARVGERVGGGRG
eukprot:7717697-Lingulodinium_polyedra.AAC.1